MARLFDVLLHGQLVGELRETGNGYTEFRLVDAYRRLPPSRPVLGQKFIDAPGSPMLVSFGSYRYSSPISYRRASSDRFSSTACL
jgi:hypothetical protein